MKNSHILIAIFAVCITCGFLSWGIRSLTLAGEEVVTVEEAVVQRRVRLKDLDERAARQAERKITSMQRKDEASGQTDDSDSQERENNLMETNGATSSGEDALESFLWEDSYAFAYQNMTPAKQLWYQDIAAALGTMTDGVKLSKAGLEQGLDEEDVDGIFQRVLDDHPELFYVEGYSYTRYTRGERTVAIEFSGTYSMDWDTACTRWKQISDNVEELLKNAPVFRDDYAKVKYVYETLILNTNYDQKAPDNQNIYSVFVGHASVCQGYAKAFQYLLNRLGVECTLIQGEVLESGEGHAWNLVQADGDFYYVDATWGDVSYRNGRSEVEAAEEDGDVFDSKLPWQISYDYLCITTEQLLRTHRPDAELGLPYCTADKDNYFVREGALFAEYDREQMRQLVERHIYEETEVPADGVMEGGDVEASKRQVRQGDIIISLRCADQQCYQMMYDALLEEREFFEYLAGTGIDSFVYSCNDKQYTLTFFMVTSVQ